MIRKSEALAILQDIESNLDSKNWKKALKDTNCYIKNIELTVNEKIKKLEDIHVKCLKKYGENHIKTIIIRKKLDKEIRKILSKKD